MGSTGLDLDQRLVAAGLERFGWAGSGQAICYALLLLEMGVDTGRLRDAIGIATMGGYLIPYAGAPAAHGHTSAAIGHQLS